MNFFGGVARFFGYNGQAEEKPNGKTAVDLETFDDEETKMIIELDADEAEELLRLAGIEQKASAETFSMETVNLKGRISDSLNLEGNDDERIPAAG